VTSLLDQRRGPSAALSEEKEVGYSVVVKMTETAPPTDQMIADPENSDQMVIQRVLSGNRDAFKLLISFIKAYQHLAEVRGRFDAWVFRIVANGCKDWLKNIRRSHLSYDEDDQPSAYATPDEELDRTELRSDLDRALATLPASLREAFVMKHVEGRSYEEMADLLGTTVGALKMRVHRAREALQALLEEKYA
jgi:RNA polymerase sigma-70 factor (ECF subfamily)